jgi:NAD(P)-dependent dehydrogenase (short-subunit alcohol dehydrogenase family)
VSITSVLISVFIWFALLFIYWKTPQRGLPRYAAYTASKFALVGFTPSFAHEMGPYRVNVNAICPGLAETERVIHIANALKGEGEMADDQLAAMVRERSAVNPLDRITETRDIANMAAFLSSDQADYLAGLAVTVAGGDVMS